MSVKKTEINKEKNLKGKKGRIVICSKIWENTKTVK